MERIKVWTKQHENVLKELMSTGRYTAKRDYIRMDLREHANLVLEVYDWLVKNGPDAANRPADVEYPVWVSFVSEGTMMAEKGYQILELTIDPKIITPVNISKWGAILNYSYIPADEADARRHYELLDMYGIDDAKAYMTQFYPQIKREIVDSWKRLFDEKIRMGNDLKYGTIWEIKREWLTDVIQ